MTAQAPAREQGPARDVRRTRPRGVLALRILGWTLITTGAVVALYVVYALWFSDLGTQREQAQLIEEWEAELGPLEGLEVDEVDETPLEPDATTPELDAGDDAAAPLDAGDAMAVLAFHRPGEDERPVNPNPLAVIEGVGVPQLQRGPGHYPGTTLPGEEGNFAVAGHRVTYARPFHNLEEIRPGDEVHVWDRSGARHVYEVVGTEIVHPSETWVLGDDPLETGRPTITLTTCHPKFSNRERMIMFGELVE